MISQTRWYEYILYFLPFVLILIWENSVELCSIVPVVGGAIGGGVSALVSLVALVLSKKSSNILYKLLIGIAGIIVAFALCAAIGFMIVSSLS